MATEKAQNSCSTAGFLSQHVTGERGADVPTKEPSMSAIDVARGKDHCGLERFLVAQEEVYRTVLAELHAGRKRTHWMWFVFPQFDGLGASPTSRHYAIKSLDEARRYLEHPTLGPRLRECAEMLLTLVGVTASGIFPAPDDMKLKSSMTLFEAAAPAGSVFGQVLDRYFRGERDHATLRLIERGGGRADPTNA